MAPILTTGAGVYLAATPSSYAGPGDVVSGATAWFSTARAYSAAYAAGATKPAMDLVDQAGANTVTINILSTGFVDVAAINAWVTAHSVTTICITKVYDQTGNGNHCANVTLASMPRLTLSALNSLPGMTGTNAAATTIASSASITVSQPNTMVSVYERTVGGALNSFAFGDGAGSVGIGPGAANTTNILPANLPLAASDGSFHAVQGISASGTNNTIMTSDGTQTVGTGTGAFSATTLRILRRVGTASLDGTVMEAGLWPSGFSAGQITSMNSNMHGANGYNF